MSGLPVHVAANQLDLPAGLYQIPAEQDSLLFGRGRPRGQPATNLTNMHESFPEAFLRVHLWDLARLLIARRPTASRAETPKSPCSARSARDGDVRCPGHGSLSADRAGDIDRHPKVCRP